MPLLKNGYYSWIKNTSLVIFPDGFRTFFDVESGVFAIRPKVKFVATVRETCIAKFIARFRTVPERIAKKKVTKGFLFLSL